MSKMKQIWVTAETYALLHEEATRTQRTLKATTEILIRQHLGHLAENKV